MSQYDLKDILSLIFLALSGLIVVNHYAELEIEFLSTIEESVFKGSGIVTFEDYSPTYYMGKEVTDSGKCQSRIRNHGLIMRNAREILATAEEKKDTNAILDAQVALDNLEDQKASLCDGL